MRDAFILATEINRLQDLHRPRDTRKGEWPEEGQEILIWDWRQSAWEHCMWAPKDQNSIWLPAPPSPEGT